MGRDPIIQQLILNSGSPHSAGRWEEDGGGSNVASEFLVVSWIFHRLYGGREVRTCLDFFMIEDSALTSLSTSVYVCSSCRGSR